jgi:hypothetical protein
VCASIALKYFPAFIFTAGSVLRSASLHHSANRTLPVAWLCARFAGESRLFADRSEPLEACGERFDLNRGASTAMQ